LGNPPGDEAGAKWTLSWRRRRSRSSLSFVEIIAVDPFDAIGMLFSDADACSIISSASLRPSTNMTLLCNPPAYSVALSRNELVVMKIPFRLLAGQCTDERLNFRPTDRIKTFALQIRTIPSHIAALSQQTNNCGSLPL